MKHIKHILLALCLLLSVNLLQAQSKGTPDFHVADLYGNEHKLYEDYLSKGKYVFIDFFWKSCSGCYNYAPIVDSAYFDYGCNKNEIVFLAIDRTVNDAEIWEFKKSTNIEFPIISGIDGGGEKVHLNFGIQYVPYSILISPEEGYPQIIREFSPDNLSALKDTLNKLGFSESVCSGNDFEFYSLVSENDSVRADIFKENKYVEITYTPETNAVYKPVFYLSGNAKATVNGVEQISGETEIDPTQGEIVYSITAENGNTQEWEVRFISTTNVLEISKPKLFLSPNPINDNPILSIIAVKNTKVNLQITDISGRVIYNKPDIDLYSGENSIAIPEASKFIQGIYFLTLNGKDFKNTIRFIR